MFKERCVWKKAYFFARKRYGMLWRSKIAKNANFAHAVSLWEAKIF
jgi:hypothetical protein